MVSNFFIFLYKGLSPAAIVPIILNNLLFFLFKFFVSLEFITNPSNAALLPEGLFVLLKIFEAVTLFKELLLFTNSSLITIF